MSPRALRILIPVAVGGIAFGLVLAVVLSPRSGGPGASPPAGTAQQAAPSQVPATGRDGAPAEDPDGTGASPANTDEATGDASANAASGSGTEAATTEYAELRALAPAEGVTGFDIPAQTLGSLDPAVATGQISFSRACAGMEVVALSEHWIVAKSKHRADAHHKAVRLNDLNPPPLPPETDRYVIRPQKPVGQIEVPLLAAHSIIVNGTRVSLFDFSSSDRERIWAETGPGAFRTTIVAADGTEVLSIARTFTLHRNGDIDLDQRIVNLTDGPVEVSWIQYGPGDLIPDRARYMDRRRFRFGYLPNPVASPNLVLAEDNDLLFERSDISKRADKATNPLLSEQERVELLTMWPNETSREHGYELTWFASTNRYFGIAVHPRLGDDGTGSRSLEQIVNDIRFQSVNASDREAPLYTYMRGPPRTIPAGGATAYDLGVYAGPLERHVLATSPYDWLSMQGLILYQMSSCCAICTFQPLAKLLLVFLSFLRNYVVFDWGLAIIVLVVCVRTLLHPITKRAQVNMQRFGKVMGDLKPEIEKLQKKYPNDPRKMQQEQIRMMRERGVNPFQMLGCLPMFLQMPIWVALYAMLYFAFDIRHEPAFWGLFQWVTGGSWQFLADLSAADHCFWQFAQPINIFSSINVTGINLLPLLMGLVFYFQQKYMSPPTSATMTPEQQSQQKIMKIMMVVMFPVMLYNAPSGLTLYIFTSSCIGILESRYVRAHVKAMDLNPPPPKTRKKKKKSRDPQGRAYAAMLERAKDKRKGPEKKWKKRGS